MACLALDMCELWLSQVMNVSGTLVAVQSVHHFLAHHQKPRNSLAFQDMSRSTVYSSLQTCFCCNFGQSVYSVSVIFPFQGSFSPMEQFLMLIQRQQCEDRENCSCLGKDLSSLLF